MNSIFSTATESAHGNSEAVKTVGFVDDVFRHSYWPAKEFIYDLLRIPLRKVTGETPQMSVRHLMWQDGLLTPRSVPAGPRDEPRWAEQYNGLYPDSKAALARYIDPGKLYICYEASPGLLSFLNEHGVTYVDVRISPLRFLPDLLFALRSNSTSINEILARAALSGSEIETEAQLLCASFRHRERYDRRDIASNGTAPVYFVGQTPNDASIIVEQKAFRLTDAVHFLAERLNGRQVVYLKHPWAPAQHIQAETSLLASVCKSLFMTDANSYDLLCSEAPAEFIGISSGLLQEAAFFDKKATAILPHVCPLAPDDGPSATGYYQFTFGMFMSGEFWRSILAGHSFIRRDTTGNLKPNQLRELHDVWWGYAVHKARPNDYTRAQSRDLQKQLTQVQGQAQLLMDLVTSHPSATAGGGDPISSRRWKWVSGGLVTFEPGGLIYRDGIRTGVWRRVNTAHNTVLAIWDNGGWLDIVHYDGHGTLTCRNNSGHTFHVQAA